VRKIISILLTLGVVLGLTLAAAPASADVTKAVVSTDPDCACVVAAYNISFNTTASLTEGVTCVCIDFPAGTTVPATGVYPAGAWKDGEIVINGYSVFAEEITVTGTEVCFLAPVDIPAGPILVEFSLGAGIKNPCEAGKYKLEVYTCRAPDATPVLSQPYTIIPCYSSYGFTWDSSPTYPGIAKGFLPPFKACGQEGFPGAVEFETGKFQNAFNLTFGALPPVGCESPCSAVEIYMSLIAAPQFPCAEVDPHATVTLNLSTPSEWTGGELVWDACSMLEPEEILIHKIATLEADTSVTWEGLIHFDTVGSYTIKFWAVCPGGTVGDICQQTDIEDVILAEKSFDFEVHQWKDAGKITLDEKWNLISLPLVPFDTDIDVLLGSLPAAAKNADGVDDLISIWGYDRCSDTWSVYGNGQSSLTDMVDGASYWVRMSYPMAGNYTWWVWGTARAMPPSAPSAYSMCAGWNMFGFTSLSDILVDTYLWNLVGTANEPLVYGWDNTGDWTTSGWNLITFGADNLVSGQGYWGAFPAAATIIP